MAHSFLTLRSWHMRTVQILRWYRRHMVMVTAVLAVLVMLCVFTPPLRFPTGETITVAEGASIGEVALQLEEGKVIRHPWVMKLLVRLARGDASVIAGSYRFDTPLGIFEVVSRVTRGVYGVESVRVVFPEGTSVREMADILGETLPDFDTNVFVKHAERYEGYLFPDTYDFLPTVRPYRVVETLRETFDERMEELQGELDAFGMSLEDVVTMASIIQEEAYEEEAQRMIADILWRRLEIGMRLQVDATFLYINGRNTFELTQEDLKHESPYNTYVHTGLPPGPITNPGLQTLRATVTPIPNAYLFYLSDLEGVMHYAEDFEGHKRNKFRYLR